jgi:hypothetical protein
LTLNRSLTLSHCLFHAKNLQGRNSTIAIEQETILAFRAIILLQPWTFLGLNWGNLILEAIVAVLNLEVAVLRAIVAVSNRKC